MRWKLGTGVELVGEALDLSGGRDLTGQKEPEKALRERLIPGTRSSKLNTRGQLQARLGLVITCRSSHQCGLEEETGALGWCT